jgi:hypothetical protein
MLTQGRVLADYCIVNRRFETGESEFVYLCLHQGVSL